jgi:predicted transcriptional regulator
MMIEHTVDELEEILRIKMGYPFEILEHDCECGTIKAECIMLDTGRFVYNYGERWWEMTEEESKEMIDRAKGLDKFGYGFNRELTDD